MRRTSVLGRVSRQDVNLGDMTEAFVDGLGSHLPSSAEITLPEPHIEGEEEFLLDGLVGAPEVEVSSPVASALAPCEPVAHALGIVHRRSGNLCLRNTESTSKVMFRVGCTACQE